LIANVRKVKPAETRVAEVPTGPCRWRVGPPNGEDRKDSTAASTTARKMRFMVEFLSMGRSGLTAWQRQMIEMWGRDNEWVRVHVLSKKPRKPPTPLPSSEGPTERLSCGKR